MHKNMGWGKLFFLCALAGIVFLFGQGKIRDRIAELNQEETYLSMELADVRDDAEEVKRQIAMVGTDVQIMSEAREKYDFINPGEMRFAFSNPGALDDYTEEERRILNYEKSID